MAPFLFPKLGIRLGTGLVSQIVYSAICAVILLLVVRLVAEAGSSPRPDGSELSGSGFPGRA